MSLRCISVLSYKTIYQSIGKESQCSQIRKNETFCGIIFKIIIFYCSKDVRLPQQLQRAMAAEAEAAREARAKVIAAEGEHQVRRG